MHLIQLQITGVDLMDLKNKAVPVMRGLQCRLFTNRI